MLKAHKMSQKFAKRLASSDDDFKPGSQVIEIGQKSFMEKVDVREREKLKAAFHRMDILGQLMGHAQPDPSTIFI